TSDAMAAPLSWGAAGVRDWIAVRSTSEVFWPALALASSIVTAPFCNDIIDAVAKASFETVAVRTCGVVDVSAFDDGRAMRRARSMPGSGAGAAAAAGASGVVVIDGASVPREAAAIISASPRTLAVTGLASPVSREVRNRRTTADVLRFSARLAATSVTGV